MRNDNSKNEKDKNKRKEKTKRNEEIKKRAQFYKRGAKNKRSFTTFTNSRDINECFLNIAQRCNSKSDCVNTNGSYYCCDQGFQANENNTGCEGGRRNTEERKIKKTGKEKIRDNEREEQPRIIVVIKDFKQTRTMQDVKVGEKNEFNEKKGK